MHGVPDFLAAGKYWAPSIARKSPDFSLTQNVLKILGVGDGVKGTVVRARHYQGLQGLSAALTGNASLLVPFCSIPEQCSLITAPLSCIISDCYFCALTPTFFILL